MEISFAGSRVIENILNSLIRIKEKHVLSHYFHSYMRIITYDQHYKLILLDSKRLQVWLHFKSQTGIIFMIINAIKVVVLAIP